MNEDLPAFRALADLMPFVLEDYYPDMATAPFRAAVEAAKAVIAQKPVAHLTPTCPLVLYFDNEADRQEFIDAIASRPGIRTQKL